MVTKKERPKKALLVGINEYADPRVPQLRGCLNDVTNVLHVLKTYFGFQNRDVRVLTDTMATTAAIEREMNWLLADAHAGAVRLFHFSGHGSQVPDAGGEESDGYDEVLCPYDVDWNSGRYITDDKLGELLNRADRRAHIELVFDCCHSGTATRAMPAVTERWEPLGDVGVLQARYLPPPLGVQLRWDGAEQDALRVRRLRRMLPKPPHVLWAAAKDSQQSADAIIDGRAAGAFTYYFCKHLRAAEGKQTRAELLKRVRASLRAGRFGHIPQLDAPAEVTKSNVFELPRGRIVGS